MAVATETVVGSHVLTIHEYTKTTAALAVGESIQSDVFRVGGHDWSIDFSIADEWWVGVFLRFHHGGGGGNQQQVKAKPKFILLDHAGEEIISYGRYGGETHTFSPADDGAPADWGTREFVQRKTLEAYLIVHGDNDCCRIRCDVAVIKEPPPLDDLHRRNLGELLLATEVGRDVTFVVGGEQFAAHSCVLAARSSSTVLMEKIVLAGAGKESAAAAAAVVVDDGIAPRVFKALLHFIYTDSVPDDDEEADRIAVVLGLLAAADRYDMARLDLVCRNLLLDSEVGRDVTFVVHEEVFTAHRFVLAARSPPAFMAEVLERGKGKESAVVGGSRHVWVKIDGIQSDVFRALLHFIYTDSLPDEMVCCGCGFNVTIARGLLAAADRYDMERLKTACTDKLRSNIIIDATALDLLALAHKHGCLEINQACVEFIRGKLDALSLEQAK